MERVIIAEELTAEAIAGYGTAIEAPADLTPRVGLGWQCWFGLGTMSRGEPLVGIVKTRPAGGIVPMMERHPTTEFLLPISGPVIQPLGLPGNFDNHREDPDPMTVRAFIIRPGQAVLMAPATWHWAALPLHDEEVLYYYMVEPHPLEPGRGPDLMVPFPHGDTVRVLVR
jgi:ureidoglycolate lyase